MKLFPNPLEDEDQSVPATPNNVGDLVAFALSNRQSMPKMLEFFGDRIKTQFAEQKIRCVVLSYLCAVRFLFSIFPQLNLYPYTYPI